MPRGISLHIGLDYLDPDHYTPYSDLPNCPNDATEMESIACAEGFETTLLLNEAATSAELFNFLDNAALQLGDGDIFFLSISGHGGIVKDFNQDEDGGWDQVFCMYDKMIVDDQLFLHWAKFRKGVRVLVVADSCYSGSLIKSYTTGTIDAAATAAKYEGSMTAETLKKHETFYNAAFTNLTARLPAAIQCSVLLLAACQDNETAGGGRKNDRLSAFTAVLVECWDKGCFEGNYRQFHDMIRKKMRDTRRSQVPSYRFEGEKHPFFQNQRPFTI